MKGMPRHSSKKNFLGKSRENYSTL